MNVSLRIVFLMVSFCFTQLYSNIVSIQSFKEIYLELDKADQDTLVIFDVDDVLITYKDVILRPSRSHFRPTSWKNIDQKECIFLISIMISEASSKHAVLLQHAPLRTVLATFTAHCSSLSKAYY